MQKLATTSKKNAHHYLFESGSKRKIINIFKRRKKKILEKPYSCLGIL